MFTWHHCVIFRNFLAQKLYWNKWIIFDISSWSNFGVLRVPIPCVVIATGGERGGSVVECRTPEREVRGSRPTAAVLCPWARHFTPRKYWLITQEAMAPSRYDWKIVDWDVKPQHNQPTIATGTVFIYGREHCWCNIWFTLVICKTCVKIYTRNNESKSCLRTFRTTLIHYKLSEKSLGLRIVLPPTL